MDKQAFQAAVERYAAQLMEAARRSRFPLEQTPDAPQPDLLDEVEINPPEAGEGQDPLQPVEEPSETYEQFLQHNRQSGEMRIQAYAGRQARPVADADVVISRQFTDGRHVFFEGKTDESGVLDGIQLPAPDPALSESPAGTPPYATYDIRVSHPGYRTEIYLEAPVFPGIKSIQPVRFLPDNSPS